MPDTFNSVPSAWVELKLNNIATGTQANAFVGEHYRLKSVMFYGIIQTAANGGVADDAYNVFRIILALWDPWATDAPLTDIGAGINEPAMRKITHPHLLKRYVDKTFVITGQQDDVGYIPGFKKVRYYKRFKGAGLKFNIGQAGSFDEKKLILSMCSDSVGVPNPGFVTGHWRIKWKDI